jgi:hypothetical protein
VTKRHDQTTAKRKKKKDAEVQEMAREMQLAPVQLMTVTKKDK